MFHVLRFLLIMFVNLTLLIFPNKLIICLKYIFNAILSKRFILLSKSKGSASLCYPFYVKGHKYITFKSFMASPGFRIECWDYYQGHFYKPSISIGDNVCFNYNCHIGAINKICIGNNVLVGSQVLITDHSHGELNQTDLLLSPGKRKLYSKGPVIIGDDVWIGEGVCILPNVTIGNNSVIGANSVVTHDIPPFSIVGGNPARIIKHINDLV